jgi:hypothetical protein|tara:strand:- start:13840 stop:14163 length:324 start_codon:yes stop_codon:yes gene_type:complete
VIDGIVRTTEQEEELNKLFVSVFGGPGGDLVLNYLASVTINQISGPGLNVNSLIHLEGQRFLFGVIRQRLNEGKNVRHNGSDSPRKRAPRSAARRSSRKSASGDKSA